MLKLTVRNSNYILLILFLTYVVSFIDRSIFNLLVHDIKADLSITDTQIALLQGVAFAVCFLLASVPLAALADRYSRKKIIVVGILIWSIATAFCAFSNSFWTMFLARMFIGIGEAALTPAALSILSDYFNRERLGRALSLYSSGIWVGTGLALLFGAIFLEHIGTFKVVYSLGLSHLAEWRLSFLICSLPGIVVAILVCTISEPPRFGPLKSAKNENVDEAAPPFSAVVRFVNRHKRFFVFHYLGFAMFTLLAQAVLAWSPEVMMRKFSASAAQVGFTLGISHLIFSVLGIYVGGVLSDKMSAGSDLSAPMKIGALGTLALAPFTVGFSLAPSFEIAQIFAIGMAFFISMPLGVAATAIQLVAPIRMKAQLSALYIVIVGLVGICFGPISVAVITDYVFTDINYAPYSLALVALVSGPIATLLLLSGRSEMIALIEGKPIKNKLVSNVRYSTKKSLIPDSVPSEVVLRHDT